MRQRNANEPLDWFNVEQVMLRTEQFIEEMEAEPEKFITELEAMPDSAVGDHQGLDRDIEAIRSGKLSIRKLLSHLPAALTQRAICFQSFKKVADGFLIENYDDCSDPTRNLLRITWDCVRVSAILSVACNQKSFMEVQTARTQFWSVTKRLDIVTADAWKLSQSVTLPGLSEWPEECRAVESNYVRLALRLAQRIVRMIALAVNPVAMSKVPPLYDREPLPDAVFDIGDHALLAAEPDLKVGIAIYFPFPMERLHARLLQLGEEVRSSRGADRQTDRRKKIRAVVPENPDVARLAKKIKMESSTGTTMIGIARSFTNGDEKKAKSLLRQLRAGRYKNLLDAQRGR